MYLSDTGAIDQSRWLQWGAVGVGLEAGRGTAHTQNGAAVDVIQIGGKSPDVGFPGAAADAADAA